jgi:hypothetical protein
MPRRKSTDDPEIPQSADGQSKNGRTRTVQAKHKIEYDAPVTVPADDIAEDEPFNEDIEDIIIEEKKQRRKTAKAERDELRKKLSANKVTPTSQLQLSIDKYMHSDSDARGTSAEMQHCTRYHCTEQHALNEDYLDVLKQWGDGLYRITLRTTKPVSIVDAWDRRVMTRPMHSQIVQNVIPGDPTSPQFTIQMPEGSHQPIAAIDPIENLAKSAKIYKSLREAFEPSGPQQQPQAPVDPETLLLQNLANNDKFMDKVNGGLIRKIFGDKAIDDDPTPWAVMMKLVETNQVGQAIDAVMRGAQMIVRQIFPTNGGNNGQAPMVPPQNAQGAGFQSPTHPNAQADQFRQNGSMEAQLQSVADPAQAGAHANTGQPSLLQIVQMLPFQHALNLMMQSQGQLASTDLALAKVMDGCMRNVPVELIADWLFGFADILNAQLPDHSIDGYIDMFAAMKPTDALTMLKSLAGPIADQISALPHATVWTESLQKLINENAAEGEDEEA